MESDFQTQAPTAPRAEKASSRGLKMEGGGLAGLFMSGASALAGIALDNEYLVGFGSGAANSLEQTYDFMNKSLVEEQRQGRLADAKLVRDKNLKKYTHELGAEERALDRGLQERQVSVSEGQLDLGRDQLTQQQTQFDATKAQEQNQFEQKMALSWSQKEMNEKQIDASIENMLANQGFKGEELKLKAEETKARISSMAVSDEYTKMQTDAGRQSMKQSAELHPIKVSSLKTQQAMAEHELKMQQNPGYARTYTEWQNKLNTDMKIEDAKAMFNATQEMGRDKFNQQMDALRATGKVSDEFLALMEIDHALGDNVQLVSSVLSSKTAKGGKGGTGSVFDGLGAAGRQDMVEYLTDQELANDDTLTPTEAAQRATQAVIAIEASLQQKFNRAGGSAMDMIMKRDDISIEQMSAEALANFTSGEVTPQQALELARTPDEKAAVNMAIRQFGINQEEQVGFLPEPGSFPGPALQGSQKPRFGSRSWFGEKNKGWAEKTQNDVNY